MSASPASTAFSENRARLDAASVLIVVAGMEGACPAWSRPGRQTGHRGADQHRLWRQFSRSRGTVRHAQFLRGRRDRGQHRQWLRRGVCGEPNKPGINRRPMQCFHCGREVFGTVHTQKTYWVDYYRLHTGHSEWDVLVTPQNRCTTAQDILN